MSRARFKKGGEANFGKPTTSEHAPKPHVYAGKGSKVAKAAVEKNAGGRAGHKGGGSVKHLEGQSDLGHAKHLGQVHGSVNFHKGRAPRKSGGRAGSNHNPLSSAATGSAPRGHSTPEDAK